MSKLTPTLPLGGFIKEWPDLSFKEHFMGELISLACVLGNETEFKAKFISTFAKAPPEPNQIIEIEGGYAMWSGQDQYMIILTGENIDADLDLSKKFRGAAYTTLQTDGWASLELIGTKSFDVLERFIPLDIRRAPKHFAARTSAHHIAVMVLKFSETKFLLLTPRSSAHSFLDGLVHVAKNVLG